jgi:hypothetical protein
MLKIRYSKRGIMLEFLTRFLLALIIFIPVVMIGCSLFRLSDKAKNSYYGLIQEIKDLDEGEQTPYVLHMDKGTFIAGFNKNVDELIFKITYGPGGPPEPIFEFTIPKPTGCASTRACICLCQNVDRDKFKKKRVEYDVICQKAICDSVDMKFTSYPEIIVVDGEVVGGSSIAAELNAEVIGGFIIERNSVLKDIKDSSRIRSISIFRSEIEDRHEITIRSAFD